MTFVRLPSSKRYPYEGMSPRQREAFALKYGGALGFGELAEPLSYADVAARMGVERKTAETHIRRAARRFAANGYAIQLSRAPAA